MSLDMTVTSVDEEVTLFFPSPKKEKVDLWKEKKRLFDVPGLVKLFLVLKAVGVHQPCHTFSKGICHL